MRRFTGIAILLMAATAGAQTTEFTQKGRLQDGGAPANGAYDFEFRLYTAPTSGTLLGSRRLRS